MGHRTTIGAGDDTSWRVSRRQLLSAVAGHRALKRRQRGQAGRSRVVRCCLPQTARLCSRERTRWRRRSAVVARDACSSRAQHLGPSAAQGRTASWRASEAAVAPPWADTSRGRHGICVHRHPWCVWVLVRAGSTVAHHHVTHTRQGRAPSPNQGPFAAAWQESWQGLRPCQDSCATRPTLHRARQNVIHFRLGF
eukprot:COSAG06_NODE_5846_length_3248_cov_1.339155_3_plen_195_part_00